MPVISVCQLDRLQEIMSCQSDLTIKTRFSHGIHRTQDAVRIACAAPVRMARTAIRVPDVPPYHVAQLLRLCEHTLQSTYHKPERPVKYSADGHAQTVRLFQRLLPLGTVQVHCTTVSSELCCTSQNLCHLVFAALWKRRMTCQASGATAARDQALREQLSGLAFKAETQLALRLLMTMPGELFGFPYLHDYEWQPVYGQQHFESGNLIFTDGQGIFVTLQVKDIDPAVKGETARLYQQAITSSSQFAARNNHLIVLPAIYTPERGLNWMHQQGAPFNCVTTAFAKAAKDSMSLLRWSKLSPVQPLHKPAKFKPDVFPDTTATVLFAPKLRFNFEETQTKQSQEPTIRAGITTGQIILVFVFGAILLTMLMAEASQGVSLHSDW